MALTADADLMILDEPTTGLDVTTEAHVLDPLAEIRARVQGAVVYISHDLAVIADRVAVMCDGQIVELGTAEQVFARPAAPYTAGLLA